MSESELGTYLRSRREALAPERVGLPAGPRRRAPGLRREELATLSGVSVDYLTRLEQGRDRNPSPQVLVALADALLLSAGERVLLRNLSKAASGAGALCPGGQPPAREVRPTMRALLDQWEPTPAALFNRVGETLAYTPAYERLAGPLGLLDGDGEPANRVWFLFADDRAREVYPDWDLVADERIAALRSESALDDPHLAHLVEELTIVGGAPFTDRLAAPLVPPRRTGVERLAHPEVGVVRLSYEVLDAEEQQLVAYLPADDATAAALDHLAHRRPGALRAVNA